MKINPLTMNLQAYRNDYNKHVYYQKILKRAPFWVFRAIHEVIKHTFKCTYKCLSTSTHPRAKKEERSYWLGH